MTGPEAAKVIRASRDVPIFGLTGNVMKDDIDHFLASGADHVFEKPLDIMLFHAKLESLNETIEYM